MSLDQAKRASAYERFRRAAFVLLRLTCLPLLMRELVRRRQPTILVYHDLLPAQARRHFKALRRPYNLIGLADYLSALERDTVDQLPPKSLVITFDDGHRSNHDLLPLFQEHGIRPTILLCAGVIDTRRRFWWLHPPAAENCQRLKKVSDQERLERLRLCGFEETKEFDTRQALNREEIEEMKSQVDFQSHTVFHPILPRCTDIRARSEIELSRKTLQEDYSLEIYALAFPNGDFSEREISLARETGYRCVLTQEGQGGCNGTGLFRMARICVPDDAGVSELLVKASGLWDRFRLNRLFRNLRSGYAVG